MKNLIAIYLKQAVMLMITALVLGSCFVIDKSLFNGIITAKHLWVQLLVVMTIVFTGVTIFFTKKVNFHSIDILVGVFILWMIGRELFSEMPYANPRQYLINVALYFALYLFFRLIGKHPFLLLSLIIIYLSIVSAQAIIGLLQLYGVIYSHHGLFNTTGSFHNPGPFSGFVVSGLPIALGLYLVTDSSNRLAVDGNQLSVNSNQLSVISGQLAEGKFSLLLRVWFWVKNQFCEVNTDKLLNYFAQFAIVVLLLVLPAAQSRAAWLGAIVGCLYIAWQLKLFRKVTQWFTKSHKEKLSCSLHLRTTMVYKVRKFIVAFVILILVLSLFGLYKFKQGSADGRMLMWQVSWKMIKDKPFAGWGQGGFETSFANYQAEWFKSGKGTEAQALVAGVPDAPFNEFIRVWISYGAVGMLLLLSIFLFVLSSGFNSKPKTQHIELETQNPKLKTQNSRLAILLKGGLLSIIVFSLFSYPVDVAPIMVQIILLTSLLATLGTTVSFKSNPSVSAVSCKIIAILLLVLIPYGVGQIENQHKGLKHWQEAHQLYGYSIYDDGAEEYRSALEHLAKNGLLLQMYGKCLVMDEKHEEANRVLEKATQLRSDPILYTALGDNYKALKEYQLAESAYEHAWQMVPHKFYPKFLLVKLYEDSGQSLKAKQVAEELLNKEIKVSSSAIIEMKEELKRLFEK